MIIGIFLQFIRIACIKSKSPGWVISSLSEAHGFPVWGWGDWGFILTG